MDEVVPDLRPGTYSRYSLDADKSNFERGEGKGMGRNGKREDEDGIGRGYY